MNKNKNSRKYKKETNKNISLWHQKLFNDRAFNKEKQEQFKFPNFEIII